MLEFYEFNTLNISIVLISTFIIYYILSNYFNNSNIDSENKKQFSFESLLVAGIISIVISLIIAYIMSGQDESVLTDNFWDPIKETSFEINNWGFSLYK